MAKKRSLSVSIQMVFFVLLTFFLKAQQTITYSKQNLNESLSSELSQKGFIGLSDAMAWKVLSEPDLSRIYEKSVIEKHKLITIIKGLQRGDLYAEALALELLIVADPAAKNILSFSLSSYHFKKENYAEAIEYFERTDPTYFSNDVNELIQFQKGICYFSLRQFNNAKPFFQSLVQIENSSYVSPSKYYLGFMAFSSQSFPEALSYFNNLIDDSYYKTVVPFYIAYIYYQLGDSERSIEIAERYMKGDGILHANETAQLLANIYFNKGLFEKSNALYEKSISAGVVLEPVQRYELGVGYFGVGNSDKSITVLKSLSGGSDSVSAQSMFFLANAYLNSGDKKQARNSFSLSLSMLLSKERKELALFNYAKLSLEQGFMDEGFKKMNEFIQSFPQSKYSDNAREVLVEYFSKTNEFKQAIALLEKYPGNEWSSRPLVHRIYFGRSLELLNESNYIQSLKYLDEVIKYKSSSFYYPALFWKGEIYQRQKLFQQSIKLFSEYLKVQSNPVGLANRINASYAIATAQYELGAFADALVSYERLKNDRLIIELKLKNELLLRAADCALMLNDVKKARLLYAQSLKEFNTDYAAFQIAIIEGIENPLEKIQLLSSLEKSQPNTTLLPKLTMEIADTYISEEKYAFAIPYLNKLMILVDDKDPLYTQALLKLGVVYSNLDRTEDAIIQFKKILAEFPSSSEAKDAIESAKAIYVESGRMGEFTEFLRIGKVELGLIEKDSLTFQFVQKKMLDANTSSSYAAIESYLSDFPNGLFTAEVLNYKVQLLQSDKRWKEMLDVVDQVLNQKGSKYREQSLRLAASVQFFEFKNYSKTTSLFEELLRFSNSPEIRLESLKGIVRSFYHLRDWDKGYSYAEQLLKVDANPDDYAYSNLIVGYQEQNNQLFDLSSQYFNKVLNAGSTILKPEAAFQYSYNIYKSADYGEAEKTIVSLIKKYGTDEFWNTKCYILLGDIFIAQKDFFNARATLQSVFDNSFNEELKKEASEKLKKLTDLEHKTNSK